MIPSLVTFASLCLQNLPQLSLPELVMTQCLRRVQSDAVKRHLGGWYQKATYFDVSHEVTLGRNSVRRIAVCRLNVSDQCCQLICRPAANPAHILLMGHHVHWTQASTSQAIQHMHPGFIDLQAAALQSIWIHLLNLVCPSS